jgi:hypothetical protein
MIPILVDTEGESDVQFKFKNYFQMIFFICYIQLQGTSISAVKNLQKKKLNQYAPQTKLQS